MAKKKTNSKKTAGKPKPATETLEVPAVVSDIRNIAGDLGKVSTLPDNLIAGRDKLMVSINKFANRVEDSYSAAVKKAEKAIAKAKREAAKAEREKAKADKKAKKIAALKAQIAKLEAEGGEAVS